MCSQFYSLQFDSVAFFTDARASRPNKQHFQYLCPTHYTCVRVSHTNSSYLSSSVVTIDGGSAVCFWSSMVMSGSSLVTTKRPPATGHEQEASGLINVPNPPRISSLPPTIPLGVTRSASSIAESAPTATPSPTGPSPTRPSPTSLATTVGELN